jgi:dCMP deaminase
MSRNLILYVPVIHKGYIDFFSTNKDTIKHIYLIADSFGESMSLKPDIASLPAEDIKRFLQHFGYSNISIFSDEQAVELAQTPLMLINDQLSRALAQRFFMNSDIQWANIFLRWDRDSVFAEEDPTIKTTTEAFDVEMMQRAQIEAQKSPDWWRQVGAVLVRNRDVVDLVFNESMPSDHSIYQRGAIRDTLQPGERPDLSDTIHAEQQIIVNAARKGISVEGASLYVTHFPCPVCAKLIAKSGIKKCFYFEGSSSLKGKELLENAGVDLARVVL